MTNSIIDLEISTKHNDLSENIIVKICRDIIEIEQKGKNESSTENERAEKMAEAIKQIVAAEGLSCEPFLPAL